MSYELWDFETGNALGEYPKEADALAVVRNNVRAHGPSVIQGVALLVTSGDDSRVVAQGDELLRLVLKNAAPG